MPSDLGGERVSFFNESGTEVRGVLIEGGEGAGIVMLLHGIRANRAEMYGRARFLAAAGYTVLAFDFQAHGETPGRRITAGYRESNDAIAARRFLLDRWPSARVGAIGNSMGGAALLLASPPLPLQAIVLEAVYPTIEEAVGNRLRARLGRFGSLVLPALMLQLDLRLGIEAIAMRPVERVGVMAAPVFVVGGANDPYTPPEATRRLFESGVEPKQLWIVDGVGHEDVHRKAGAEYERRVLAFLATYLRP
jgi:pimeloyl-ACP methyl ester carboxylesterase